MLGFFFDQLSRFQQVVRVPAEPIVWQPQIFGRLHLKSGSIQRGFEAGAARSDTWLHTETKA